MKLVEVKDPGMLGPGQAYDPVKGSWYTWPGHRPPPEGCLWRVQHARGFNPEAFGAASSTPIKTKFVGSLEEAATVAYYLHGTLVYTVSVGDAGGQLLPSNLLEIFPELPDDVLAALEGAGAIGIVPAKKFGGRTGDWMSPPLSWEWPPAAEKSFGRRPIRGI
jgi:hypothetical protein